MWVRDAKHFSVLFQYFSHGNSIVNVKLNNLEVIAWRINLLYFVMNPEIQSEVYIERGKYSAFESLQRLGEVDNTGDMVTYGYGFYKINTT